VQITLINESSNLTVAVAQPDKDMQTEQFCVELACIVVGDRMFWGMQDSDFFPNRIKFYPIYPNFAQIKKKYAAASSKSPAPLRHCWNDRNAEHVINSTSITTT